MNRVARRPAMSPLLAVVLASALALTGCAGHPVDPAEATRAGSPSVPRLTIGTREVEPSSSTVASRGVPSPSRTASEAKPRSEPAPADARLRIASEHVVKELHLGVFGSVTEQGLPKDGGDQYDCLHSAACKVSRRAGSLVFEAPPSEHPRLLVVRAVYDIADATTMNVVWRIAVAG